MKSNPTRNPKRNFRYEFPSNNQLKDFSMTQTMSWASTGQLLTEAGDHAKQSNRSSTLELSQFLQGLPLGNPEARPQGRGDRRLDAWLEGCRRARRQDAAR
jgi:hypothetical protein